MAGTERQQQIAAYGGAIAEVRTRVGRAGVELTKANEKLDALPRDPDALATELGIPAEHGPAAVERVEKLASMVDAELDLINRRICFLDQAIRARNNPQYTDVMRAVMMKNLFECAVSGDPDTTYEQKNWTNMEREARFEFHDSYTRGMMRVGYGTARFVGSMTGGSDLMTLVFGVNDEGKQAGWLERAAAFLGLAGGALLSDAAKSWHLQNLVADRTASRAARQATRTPAETPSDIATSQTSSKPSGTIVDLESMGIPQRNFDKMQEYCFQNNTSVALRPTGVDAVKHLEDGATPKPLDFKSKTSQGVDGLLGADARYPGCAAAFDPKVDFFEQAMRNAGMADADVAARLDAIRAGGDAPPPKDFDAGTWKEAVDRFRFRKAEWEGAIGDGVRKTVAKGDFEINEGIIFDRSTGKPVTGDHDPFEMWVGNRAATAAEEAAFIGAMKADNAGIVHGGHARFDPQLADYQPGGRFDMKLDTSKYSPEQIEAKIRAKYEADRGIYNAIMEKHTRQALPDDVLRSMEGFETPARSHYPEGPYGDYRFEQDSALHQRWNDLQAGKEVVPPKTEAEVLVLVPPVGPPLLMRAGDSPAAVRAAAGPVSIRPIDLGPVRPGSSATLPRSLLFYGPGVLRTEEIDWDDAVPEWFALHDLLTQESHATCPEPAVSLIGAGTSIPWKPLAAALLLVALLALGLTALRGGDDPTPAAALDDVDAKAGDQVAVGDDPPTNEPPDEPPDEPAAVLVPGAQGVAIGSSCGAVTHTPPIAYPDSFSFFVLSLLVLELQGALLDGFTVTVDTPGADVAQVSADISPDGVAEAVVPISSFATYRFPSATVAGPDGTTVAVTGSIPDVVVGAAEGPVDGCTPAGDLSADQRAALARSFGVGGGGGGPGGPAVVEQPSFPAPEDDLGPYREFLTRFETAHREGDVDFLLDSLHPAAIGRYGRDQCGAYVAAVVGSVERLRVVDGRTEPWDFPFDGLTTDIAGSATIAVTGVFGGVEQSADVHLAPVDDDLAWFADCGEPQSDT